MRRPSHPRLQFVLPHKAAVKALSYCPWTHALLATGAGTKDRNIRFWHTRLGTLVGCHHTSAQVTLLTWSHFRREIAATFGFSTGPAPLLLAKYTYPAMTQLAVVPASVNLRILSASVLPDKGQLAVASNDSTIRMYPLWVPKPPALQLASNVGSYGSDLIDLSERCLLQLQPLR